MKNKVGWKIKTNIYNHFKRRKLPENNFSNVGKVTFLVFTKKLPKIALYGNLIKGNTQGYAVELGYDYDGKKQPSKLFMSQYLEIPFLLFLFLLFACHSPNWLVFILF